MALVGAGLQDAALAGQELEVWLGHPPAQRAEVVDQIVGGAERREAGQQHRDLAVDRPAQRLTVEQGEVLQQVEPSGLVQGLVGKSLPEDQVGGGGRTAHVHVEAEDAGDVGLLDRVESGIHSRPGGWLACVYFAQHGSPATAPV